MKKVLLFIVVSCLTLSCFAQVDSTTPPYKKYPVVPAFQLLLGDSTTKYTKDNLPKKKAVLLMVFSPDCEHCQHEAEQLVLHKDELKEVQIIMATSYPLWQMNEFVKTYKLNELSNVVVGQDIYYILPPYFAIHNLPFAAAYNFKGELIKTFEGSVEVEKLVKVFKENE